MSETTKQWVTGEEVAAVDLNAMLNEALNDYRDFTLGETIVANTPVYLKASDSKVYKTSSAADDEKIHSFVGFLKVGGNANDVKSVQVSGKVSGLTGLTAGQKVYIQDTAGNYGAVGTQEKLIGIAVSTTSIILRVAPEGMLTGKAQTINGVKTFGSIPDLPASDPTTGNQATRKDYVDKNPPISKNGIALYAGNTASGTQTIAHGLGRIPKKISVHAHQLYDYFGNYYYAPHSIGSYDGSSNACNYRGSLSGVLGVFPTGNSTTYSIYIAVQTPAGTISQKGIITVDATNITITWTETQAGGGSLNPANISIMWEVQ